MTRKKKETQEVLETQEGQYAYEGLDRVIHERARLGIMTSLVTKPQGILFAELKQLCALTDGNLNRHLEVLETAGFVEVWKRFQGKKPQTLTRLTTKGRKQFLAYLGELERVLADAQSAENTSPETDFGLAST